MCAHRLGDLISASLPVSILMLRLLRGPTATTSCFMRKQNCVGLPKLSWVFTNKGGPGWIAWVLETPLVCCGGKEENKDTEKPEEHPMFLIEKGNKSQTLSCDDFDLRASAVPRRRVDQQKSLQAGPCSCGNLCWLDHMAGKAGHKKEGKLPAFRLLETDEIFFFLWISEAGCVERPISSQLLLK